MKNREEIACDAVREMFALYLYGELSFDEEERVESHVEACEACRVALQKERELHAAFDSIAVEPPASLLNGCRANLEERLALERPAAHRSLWERFGESIAVHPAGINWMRPAGALALIAVGFFGARMTPPFGPAGFSAMSAIEPGAAHVRFVEPADNGRIQIVLDETRQRTITGALDDAKIRALLFAAAKDPADPGLRAETLSVLNTVPHATDVRDTLLWALQHDQNAGVRLKALEGLRPFAREREVQTALAQVLRSDTNPGLRTQAIDLLTADFDGGFDRQVIGTIQELLPRESNDYVRQRGQRLLEAVNASAEIY
jgi:hypothetical protein